MSFTVEPEDTLPSISSSRMNSRKSFRASWTLMEKGRRRSQDGLKSELQDSWCTLKRMEMVTWITTSNFTR